MFLIWAAALASDVKTAEHFPMYDGKSDRTSSLVQPYFDCAFNAAGKLEKSGDAPTEIASAALTVCSEHRDDLQASLDADLAAQPDPPPMLSDRLMSKLDEWMRNHLQMRIVAKRAIARQ